MFFISVVVLLFSSGFAKAQTASATKPDENSPATPLIQATQQYKTSSQQLLALQEKQVNEAAAKLEELKVLVSEGLVAKSELEDSEQALAALRGKVEATQKQIADTDNMIGEIRAEQELAKTAAVSKTRLVAKQYGLNTSATVLRYSGGGGWSLGDLSEVQGFFSAKFGKLLPTSAIGQSATHNRLGWDHRNAVDVAVHPDSTEGRALINYLQNQGIPFLAFRGAIPGVATGPHIHIGSPSHRLS